jgi:hypothetical protein
MSHSPWITIPGLAPGDLRKSTYLRSSGARCGHVWLQARLKRPAIGAQRLNALDWRDRTARGSAQAHEQVQ